MDKVYIKPEVHAEIMYHVHKSDVEVSGLGRVERTSTGALVVTKVYLLEQENSSATTDITEDAISKLMYETREDKGDLNFWWHSHVNMDTFWSGTDMSTIEQFGKNGYLLSTVFNKKGSHRTSYYQGNASDFLPSFFIDEIPTSFEYLPTTNQVETWEAEHKAKCKEKVFKFNKQWCNTNVEWTSAGQAIGLGDEGTQDHSDKGDFSGMSWETILFAVQEGRDTHEAYGDLDYVEETYWWDFYTAFYGYEAFQCDQVEELFDKCINMDFFINALTTIKDKKLSPKTQQAVKLQQKVNRTKRKGKRGRPRGSRNKQRGLKAGVK